MSHARRRIVIAGGGTGGHFYPGLVLARTLGERGWQSVTLVRKDDPCLEVLRRESLPFIEIDMRGMPRSFSPELFRFGWKLAAGLRLIYSVLRDFRPDVVFGMGGYLTFPAMLAAARFGLPRAVHESNAELGLANRLSLPLGARLFRGLPGRNGREAVVTGTPIRPALWNAASPAEARTQLGLDPAKPVILIFGGSQGARALNQKIPPILIAAARNFSGEIQVLHLTGAADFEAVKKSYSAAPLTSVVLPYLETMELAYASADLVICRSGASTLAELTAQRKPALLVPYPFASAAHQEQNARLFQDVGAAKMLLEREIELRLAGLVGHLLLSQEAPSVLKAMAQAYSRMALPPPWETAKKLADSIETIVQTAHTSHQR